MHAEDYASKLKFEQQHFQDQEEVHALPEIFHYWSNRHVLPMLQSCGFVNDEDLYVQYLRRAAAACEGLPRFLSIGAGNGDLEVRVAQRLRQGGLHEFVFECLEMTPAMLMRGTELAREAGLQDHLQMVEGDFNHWNPRHQYTGVIANQALHHVMELERLFDEIKRSLHPRGYFITNDMIGRNGHMRWPEALEAMRPFWLELPAEYRWNRVFRRHEEEYINHDCSTEGFEGIRAEDILPLLAERFDFPVFAAFGNLVNVFVDRVFGHNFNASEEWDRDFVDRVHAADEAGIRARTLSPTQMFAVMTPGESAEHRYARGLGPRHCIRQAPPRTGQKAPLRMETTSLRPIGGWGVEFSQQLKVSGGSQPLRFEAQNLPPGLTLSATGLLTGSVQRAGLFSIQIRAEDCAHPPQQCEQRYTLIIREDDRLPTLSLPPRLTLAPGIRNQEYHQPLLGIGGALTVRWELAGGMLPKGISLDGEKGILRGVPARDGVFGFRLNVQDARGSVAEAPMLLPILRQPCELHLILPQVAAGGRWSTRICLANPNPCAGQVALRFRDDDGKPWPLPFEVLRGHDELGSQSSSSYIHAMQPYERITLLTLESGEGDRTGWAEVECVGAVCGYAELCADGIHRAVVPLEVGGQSSILLPFVNRERERTALAVATLPDSPGKTVTLTAWDGAWHQIGTARMALKPGQHRAFHLDEIFPRIQGAEGIVELAAPTGRISAISLQFSPDGTFRLLPALRSRNL